MSCRTEQDKWKSNVEREGLWKEKVKSHSWRGKRLSGWEIQYYWGAIIHFPIYHIIPHSLQKHHNH